MSVIALNKLPPMKGAKSGKSGGSSAGAKEAPNTLQSKTLIKLMEILGEGPINRLVGSQPGQAVIMNAGQATATPMMGPDGQWLYQGANVDVRLGEPSQEPMKGFDDQVTTTQIQVPVKNQGDPIGHAVVRRVNDLDTSAVRVVMQVDSLIDIDTKTGDQNGYSVEYCIDVKQKADQPGQQFVEKVHDRITGKTTGAWQQAYRIPLEGQGPWDIRVRRLSPDDTSTSKQSSTSWALLEQITEYKLGYPHTAYVGLTADTSQFGTSIPVRGYLVEGLIVQVPSNYDAVNRTYNGVWDGTFTSAYCNNPAWVLYDILSNNRYGLGDLFTPQRLSLGKWDLYQIAKYADGYLARPDGQTDDYGPNGKHGVPDGKGGFEPRFTFNATINTKEKAYECIAAICGMMRAAMLWAGGQARMMQDRPMTAVKIFSPANVIDGTFNYTGTALRARHTAVRVLWMNPDKGWDVDDVVIEDPDAIVRYGYNLKEETAYGCTSYGQALRHARNILVTERLETDSAQWRIGSGEIDMMPGQVCDIADPSMTQAEWAGRVAQHTLGSITFDRDIQFDPARAYTLTVVLADGTLKDVGITNPGAPARTVQLTAQFDAGNRPVPNAMYAISSDVLSMRSFRLVTIGTEGDGTYKMAAMQYAHGKFAEIESGLKEAPQIYSDLPATNKVQPPTGLVLNYSAVKTSTTTEGVLEAEWDASPDVYLAGYYVEYQYGFDDWVRLPLQKSTNVRLINPKLGPVRVRVTAINMGGLASGAITRDLDLSTGTANDKNLISGLQVLGGGFTWKGRDLTFVWQARPTYGDGTLQTDGRDPFFRSFRVQIRDATTNAALGIYDTTDTKFVLPYDQMVAIGLRRSYRVSVAIEDINGAFSQGYEAVFSNPAPSLLVPQITAKPNGVTLAFAASDDADYEGQIVWTSASAGVVPSDLNKVWKNKGNPVIPVEPGQRLYLKYALYDAFGETGLNISDEVAIDVPLVEAQYLGDKTAAEIIGDIGDLQDALGSAGSAQQYAEAAEAAAQNSQNAYTQSAAARAAAEQARDAAGDYAGQSAASQALSTQAKDLAEQAKNAAAGARDAAQAASSLATTQAGLADTARQQAQSAFSAADGARATAEAKAAEAAQKASDAGGFASTASGQATIAAQKADAAGQYASNASASADTANTKASEAGSFRDQAVTAKNDAQGAASAAAASQALTTSARDAVADQFARSHPPTLEPTSRDAYYLPAGDISGPSTGWPQPYITQSPVGAIGFETYVRFRKLIPNAGGRRYRVEAWGFTYATNVSFFLGLFSSPTDRPEDTNQYHGHMSLPFLPGNALGQPYGFFKMAGEFVTDDHPNVPYFDPRLVLAPQGGANNGIVHATGLVITDITSEFAAAGSAAASLASSQSAASSADLSGQRASASDSSRALAETAAGQAEGYRNQAAQSVNDANGASSTATQQAGIATQARIDAQGAAGNSATYRDQSQGFANAASGSAGTASSQADLAGQRASAAEASRSQAETARSGAESARDTAAQARNDANGSASAAASSAVLSANAAKYAGTMASGELVRQPRFEGPNIGWTNWGAYTTGTDLGITPNVRFATFGNRDQLAYPDGPSAIQGNWSGRIIRVRARMATFASAYPVAAGFWTYRADGSIHQLVGYGHLPAMVPARQGWTEVDYLWTIAGTNEAVSLNPFIQINNDGAPNGNPGDFTGYIEYISLTDVTESQQALQQAQASSASAQAAAASNDQAGQRASAAEGSRSAAETAKGLAESARSSAAQSASDASGSKSDAAQSASISAQARDTARYTALTSMVSNFNMPDRDSYWSLGDGNGTRYYEAHNSETWGVFAVEEGKYVNFAYQGSFFPVAGRKYQTVAEVKGWQPGFVLRVGPGFYGANRDGSPFSYDTQTTLTSPADGSFAVVKSPIFVAQDGQRMSPRFVVWLGQGYVRTIKMVDITEQEEAAASAQASSNSASQASAANDQAGQRANAAETSRQQAQGYAGDALAYRNTAADYASNAQGSASTAQTASGIATSARDDTTAQIQKLIPGFESNGRYWNTDAQGGWEMNHPKGPGFSANTRDCTFSPNGYLPRVAGRRYRASVWMYRWGYDGDTVPYISVYWADFDANDQNFRYRGEGERGPDGYSAGYTAPNYGWTLLQSEYLAVDSDQERLRPRVQCLNMKGANGGMNGVVVAGWQLQDITSEWAARGQATAASGFASTASSKADLAGQSASAADGYRNQAQTAAGNADSSRAAAAQSASDALGSSNSATTQANLSASARDASVAAFARSFPPTLDPIGRQAFWYPGNAIGPSIDWPQPYITENGAGSFNYEVYVRYRKLMPKVPGRRYRARAWFFTYATNVVAFLGLFGGNTDDPSTSYAYLGTMSGGGSPTKPSNGLGQGSGFFELTGEWAADSHNVAFFDPRIIMNTDNGQTNNATVHLTGLEITDITERTAAQGFANAAQSSSASAAASNDQAGQRASAAEGSRSAAETAKGLAESARDTAVSARNDAQGSSNSASSSATLAARSAMEASQVGSGNLVPKPTFTDGSKGGWDADLKEFGTDSSISNSPGAGWFARFPNRDNLYYPYGQGIRKSWAGRSLRIRALMTSVETQYPIGAGFFGHNAAGAVVQYVVNTMPARTGWTWIDYTFTFGADDATVLINPWLQISNTGGDLGRGIVSYFEITDVTEQVKSQGYANAASGSAASAQASSDAAGNAANTARGYRDEANAANGSATAAASNAQTYANQANASAASAQSYSVIASSYASSSSNLNDKFALWTNNNPGDLPNNWIYWATEGNFRIGKQAGIGSQWAVGTLNDGANVNSGFYQPNTRVWAGKWVLETTARLDANNMIGAGVTVHGRWSIDFAREADSAGVTNAGLEGRIRTWTKMFDIDQGFVDATNGGYCNLHAMHGWDGFGQRDPRYMTWFMLRLRPATQMEIDSGKVNSIEARVSTAEGTLADVKGRTEAYSVKEVVAGAASAFISFRAKDANGNYTSDVGIGATTISLYNATAGGGFKLAMQLVGGNAVFMGGLQAGAFIRLGSGAGWPVALAQRDFTVTDDAYIDFGVNLVNVPDFTFARNNFAPLSTGQTYQVYIDNPTPTGGTLRAKIITPGSPSNVNLTEDYGAGGPTRVMDKGGNSDSTDGTYNLRITGTVTGYGYFVNDECVWVEAFLHSGKRAGDAEVGDEVLILNGEDQVFMGDIARIRFGDQLCVRLTTVSGVTLTCSTTTPVDWRDGTKGYVTEALGREMAVMDFGEFRWEEVVKVEDMGILPVALIYAHDVTYAAGDVPGRQIFTHNITQDQQVKY